MFDWLFLGLRFPLLFLFFFFVLRISCGSTSFYTSNCFSLRDELAAPSRPLVCLHRELQPNALTPSECDRFYGPYFAYLRPSFGAKCGG